MVGGPRCIFSGGLCLGGFVVRFRVCLMDCMFLSCSVVYHWVCFWWALLVCCGSCLLVCVVGIVWVVMVLGVFFVLHSGGSELWFVLVGLFVGVFCLVFWWVSLFNDFGS